MPRSIRGMTATIVAAAVPLTTLSHARADVPEYGEFELQARSNIVDGYNLPPLSSFNSGTPAINDDATMAFRLIAIGGAATPGLFVGAGGVGEVVYTGPSDLIVSDPSINTHGEVAFELFDFGGAIGVYVYDPVSGETDLAIEPGGAFNSNFLGSPQIIDDGRIGFRGKTFSGYYSFIVDDAGDQTRYATVMQLDPESPYGYLFTPATNNAGQIAGKARVGGTGNDNPDEIRIFEADGSSTLITIDDDGDPESPFTGFDNGVDLADNGLVAFVASLVGGGRGVFVSDGVTTTEIATTSDPEVSDIEFFHPAVNEDGLCVFRGKDAEDRWAIFVGDGEMLRIVVKQFDTLPTDLGTGQIAQHDDSVVFGGSPDINANGDVAFHCALTPDDDTQTEWGSGMYIAYAEEVGVDADLNDDGVVNVFDLLILLDEWGPGPSEADLNDDGVVNVFDLLVLLENWG